MATHRKLAAILAADVAGYSRLMAEDEPATLRLLNESRALFRERIETHSGRLVDTAGDSVLAEFSSPVEAVDCAVEIQRELDQRNAGLAENRRMLFRIGVNLGDVIEEDARLYGDGVNVAARLEAIAEPGRICISRTVYDQVRNKLPLTYEPLGKKALKNIAEPVEVFRVYASGAAKRKTWRATPFARRGALALVASVLLVGALFAIWQSARSPGTPVETQPKTALKLPEGPSIAVLPFQNMSGKPEDEWFSDGMTETLITDLSRLNNLFVIARNSTFAYKGKSIDVRRVGQELGVRYVLEGSVQRTTERLRVNAQLIDALTGRHVWAERYDRNLADVFDIQDDITQNIMTELDVKLLQGEQARAWRKTTRNRQAYELYLKGREHHERFTREDMARAQALHQQALELDPKFTMAMVWLGWTHYMQGDSGWSTDSTESYLKAVALGRRAIAIDPSLGDAYAGLTAWLATLEKYPEAMAAAEKAIELSPNQADILVLSGWTFATTGRANEAISLVERALRLNPLPPDWFYGALGDSLLFAKRVEEALPAHRKCVERIPDFIWCQLGITVDYVETGKNEQASIHAKEAIRINAGITAANNTYVRSIGIPEDRERVVKALRKAGLK